MYLLQSGANADISVDFTHMTFANTVVIIIGALVALVLVLFFLAKYVRKAGFIDLDKNNTIESSAYEMNKAIDGIDSQMRIKVRTVTSSLKTRLRNVFYEAGMCPVAVIALTNSALGPLYDSAANNHFTAVMLPENYDDYFDKLLKAIEDEYRSTYNAMLNFECGDRIGSMPSWDGEKDPGKEGSPRERVQKFLTDWMNSVLTETVKSCFKKIEVYKNSESALKGSKRWTDIVANCIAKNEKYISLMDRRSVRR